MSKLYGYDLQEKLDAQTNYTSKGSATKVPQITTNTLGQVTNITEVDITDNNTTYTFAEGNTDKAFTVTPSEGQAQTVSIHGLGSASLKDVTNILYTSRDEIPSSVAVGAYVSNILKGYFQYKGTLGPTTGQTHSLPTATADNSGDVYEVVDAGTYASQQAKVGDLFLSRSNSWKYIPVGDPVLGTTITVTTPVGGYELGEVIQASTPLKDILINILARGAKQVTAINVSVPSANLDAHIGEAFNTNNVSVTVTYIDSTTDTIQGSQCTITPNVITADTTAVTFSYGGVSQTVQLNSVYANVTRSSSTGCSASGTQVTRVTIGNNYQETYVTNNGYTFDGVATPYSITSGAGHYTSAELVNKTASSTGFKINNVTGDITYTFSATLIHYSFNASVTNGSATWSKSSQGYCTILDGTCYIYISHNTKYRYPQQKSDITLTGVSSFSYNNSNGTITFSASNVTGNLSLTTTCPAAYVSSISISPSSSTVIVGDTFNTHDLTVTTTYNDYPTNTTETIYGDNSIMQYKINDSVVDFSQPISSSLAGAKTVTAIYNGASAQPQTTFGLTVYSQVTGVTITTAPSTAETGTSSTRFVATVSPSTAMQTVTWSCTDADQYFSINSSTGYVTVASGADATGRTYHIVATSTQDNTKHSTASTITTITRVSSVSVSPSTSTLGINDTVTLTATVSPSYATNKAISWSSSNTNVATVSAIDSTTATVIAVGAGSATITVTTSDGSKTATHSVTVAAEGPDAYYGEISNLSSNQFVALSASDLVSSATAFDENGGKSATWSPSVNGVTILYILVKEGVSISPNTDDNYYTSGSMTSKFTVAQITGTASASNWKPSGPTTGHADIEINNIVYHVYGYRDAVASTSNVLHITIL